MRSIVGTWKLVHAVARDAAGAARPLPYGGKALGRVTFTADGRMMSVVCDGRTELPAGARREYSCYCGNTPMMASGLSRGLTGERMVLIPPPRLTGKSEEHREITWERIAAE